MENSKNRDLLSNVALSYIPRILQMCDKNPLSPTYGSFDRSFWHYKTSDFPSGMYQENVLPLALVYQHPFPGNIWFKKERVKELCCAGIYYGKFSAHSDGSCDDYYPYEKAFGATVFSLYSATESYLLLNLKQIELIDFFMRRGDFLISENESGKLSNHQALAALALYNIYLLTQKFQYKQAAEEKIKRLLSWQDSEGWFYEYEGCDPGYLTATISFLSKYFQKSLDQNVVEPLKKSIHFAFNFIHPDGSYGGEYGSRNTYHFYPHGFEIMADYSSIGKKINDLYLHGICHGKRHQNDDDRLFCHIVYDFLQAWLDYKFERSSCFYSQKLDGAQKSTYYPNSGFFLYQNKKYSAVVNLFKGGVIKAHNEFKAFVSDTGITIKDKKNNLASSAFFSKTVLISETSSIDINNHNVNSSKSNEISVSGCFYKIFNKTPSPLMQIVFRFINLSFGKINSQLVRKVLQRLLILNKKRYGLFFKRTFLFKDKSISIIDKLSPREKLNLKQVAIGSDQTFIYTAAANSYQESTLIPWYHLSAKDVEKLNAGEEIIIERVFFC